MQSYVMEGEAGLYVGVALNGGRLVANTLPMEDEEACRQSLEGTLERMGMNARRQRKRHRGGDNEQEDQDHGGDNQWLALAQNISSLIRQLDEGNEDAWAHSLQVEVSYPKGGAKGKILTALRMLVPRGSVVSYGELAKRAGIANGGRVAGTACSSNPMPLMIPCHRVLPAGLKRLGEYSGPGGPDRKRKLLKAEGNTTTFLL